VSAAVDASVVIAWQNSTHQFHQQAVAMLTQTAPPLWMSELNLAEVLVGLDQAQWDVFVTALVEVGFQFCSPSARQLARARVITGLRLPDACVLATASAQGVNQVLTFDQRLLQAAAQVGLTP